MTPVALRQTEDDELESDFVPGLAVETV
jgi:hypothetical protein